MHIPLTTPTAAASIRPAATPVRREIQALRAIAVLGVVLFHLWPHRVPGGYVGVDVFFVVSGFLISDHLVREHTTHGRIALASFWARRARRLLPASLLVLVVTTVAVALLAPINRWAQFGAEIIASALYAENWALAMKSVDYMAMSDAASPVQHFWSLGVEEQFYLVWPLLFVAGIAIAARGGRSARTGVVWIVAAVTAASFVYSIVFTWTTPSIAYYSTFTRAWEFGAGALLALALRRWPVPLASSAAAVVSWTGLATVAVTMLLFTASTPFPSWTAAIPVLGTVAVIAAGTPENPIAPSRLYRWRPVQWLGDVSYGTYLWHWPIIVIVPIALAHPLTTWQALAILVASFVLGWLSKRLVEDPLRMHRLLQGRPRRALWAAAAGMSVTVALAAPLALASVPRAPEPVASSAEQATCWGANAMTNAAACGPADEIPLAASAVSFAEDLPPADVIACETTMESGQLRRCDQVAGGDRHLMLVGDSHASRWVEAFEEVAGERGWGLSSYLVSGCPLVSAEPIGSAWGFDPVGTWLCVTPTEQVTAAILADPTITDVVFTNRTRLYISDNPADHPLQADAVDATIRTLQDAGKNVVVLADHPEVRAVPVRGGSGAIDCLAAAVSPACAMPRADADFVDPMRAGAELADAHVIDMTDQFCMTDRCLWSIGGLVVYSDDNHLTRSFARSLAPALSERLATVIG